MSIFITQPDNVGITVESDPSAIKLTAYSSIAEALTNDPSTIKVHSAVNDQIAQCTSSVFTHAIQNWIATTSGLGTNAYTAAQYSRRDFIAPNALTAGYTGAAGFYWSNTTSAAFSFDRPVVISSRVYSGASVSNAGVKARYLFTGGGGSYVPTATALTSKGFGWEFDYGTLVMSIITHNGTSQTSTTVSGFTLVGSKPVDIALYSDGAGNVSFYSNGVLLTTATATGVTGSSGTNAGWISFNLFQDVTTVNGNFTWYVSNPKLYFPIV